MPHNCTLCNAKQSNAHVAMQVKNEIGISGDPIFQVLRYFQLFYKVLGMGCEWLGEVGAIK